VASNPHSDLGFEPVNSDHDDLGFVPTPEKRETGGIGTVAKLLSGAVAPGVSAGTIADFAEHNPERAQAALEGMGKGLTMGHLAHAQAAAEPITDRIFDYFTGQHVADDEKPYVERRDENLKRQAELEEKYPKTSTAANLVGALEGGAALAPLMPEISAASVPARMGQAAMGGAAAGAMMNPGDTEGVVDPIQAEGRAKDAALGGITGGILHGALEGASALGSKAKDFAGSVGDYFKGKGEEKAFKATGAMLKDFRKANSQDRVNEIGRTLLDDGIVTPFSTPKKVADRLSSGIDQAEENLGNQIDAVHGKYNDPDFLSSLSPEQSANLERATFKPQDVAKQLKDQIKEQYQGVPLGKIQPALDEIDTWLSGQPDRMTIKDVQDLKVKMNQFLKDSDFWKDPGMQKQGTLAVRRGLKEGVENQANALADVLGEQGGQIKDTNRRLGNLLEAYKAAKDRISRDEANRAFGLTDTISAAGGAGAGAHIGGMVGGPEGAKIGAVAGAGLGGAANKLARTFGNGLQATGYDALGDVLKSSPGALAKLTGPLGEMYRQNPEAFMSAFMQNRHAPEFQQQSEAERLQNMLGKARGANREPSQGDDISTRYIPEKEAQDRFLKGN
jgi:hypothetical protein